jgi:hypothetical protein
MSGDVGAASSELTLTVRRWLADIALRSRTEAHPIARCSPIHRKVWRRRPCGFELPLALVGIAVVAAACGTASNSPDAASLGATTTTAAPAVGGTKSSDYAAAVSYAQCMRTHGVPHFPDPTSNGDFISNKGVLNGQPIKIGSSQYQDANKACSHLLPNGGEMTPAEEQQALTKALKFVQCMRTHGVPNMPDPKALNGGIAIGGRGVDPNSPQFQAAQKACRSVSPFPSP